MACLVYATSTTRSCSNSKLYTNTSTSAGVGIYAFTTTVSTTGFETLDIPTGKASNRVTLSGPTACTTAYTVASGFDTWIDPAPTPYVYTFSEILGIGSLTFEEPVGTGDTSVTLVGSTTFIATLTADPGNTNAGIKPIYNTSDPRCHQTLPATYSHLITFVQSLTVFSEGETFTTTVSPLLSGNLVPSQYFT